jgi:hypothetical protein
MDPVWVRYVACPNARNQRPARVFANEVRPRRPPYILNHDVIFLPCFPLHFVFLSVGTESVFLSVIFTKYLKRIPIYTCPFNSNTALMGSPVSATTRNDSSGVLMVATSPAW